MKKHTATKRHAAAFNLRRAVDDYLRFLAEIELDTTRRTLTKDELVSLRSSQSKVQGAMADFDQKWGVR